MKKLFFTAIGIIAFSASSMANTVEIEKVVVKTNESNPEKKLIRVACDSWAADMASADEAEFGCMSSGQYNSVYYFYLNKCNSH